MAKEIPSFLTNGHIHLRSCFSRLHCLCLQVYKMQQFPNLQIITWWFCRGVQPIRHHQICGCPDTIGSSVNSPYSRDFFSCVSLSDMWATWTYMGPHYSPLCQRGKEGKDPKNIQKLQEPKHVHLAKDKSSSNHIPTLHSLSFQRGRHMSFRRPTAGSALSICALVLGGATK